MRPDNLTLKSTVLAALAVFATAAAALTPPPAANAASAPMSVGPGKSVTSAAVEAVAIGKQDGSGDKKAAGTLRELRELQLQTALASMRKKLAEEAAPSPATAASAVVPTMAMPPVVTPASMARPAFAPPAGSTVVGSFMPFNPRDAVPVGDQPREKLVKLAIFGSRARADVLQDGKIVTVKEGDVLGKWTVSTIDTGGVTVERKVSRAVFAPAAVKVPPAGPAAPAVAVAGKRVHKSSLHAATTQNFVPPTAQREEVETFKLESAPAVDVASSMAAAGGVAPGAVTAPVIPPLPSAVVPPVKADSTSMLPPPSLPPR